MQLAEGIREHGFRKWYERELLQSHAHLVLTVFCAIGLFATFEVYDHHEPPFEQLGDVAAVLLCTVTGIWALRRYLDLLNNAEATANQVEVRCRTCEHHWPIDY